MSDDDTPEDDLRAFLDNLMRGGRLDPEQLAHLSGMQMDAAALEGLMQQMQQMFASGGSDGSISWESAKTAALHIANQDGRALASGDRTDLGQAFALADLWVSEATTLAPLSTPGRVMTRGEWVSATLPVWQEVAEPVATSISNALTEALGTQVPEDMRGMVEGAARLIRGIGGTLFATQLGHVVGKLSLEAVSGADVGIPVLPDGDAVIVPQNFHALGEGVGIPADQLALFVAARELASARLFRHAKWLRLHVMSQITDYARGISVDTDALEDLATRIDPSNPEELRAALESGALLPSQSDAQRQALERLENLLALIEGWVDVVSADATSRVPNLERIREVMRRRRAEGGPAEDALGALVGLRLRPRRLREAAMMWRAVTDAVGADGRDALWDYPDLIPTSADIDDPAALIERVQAAAAGTQLPVDEMDEALAQLLSGDEPDAPSDEPSDADEGPTGPQPV